MTKIFLIIAKFLLLVSSLVLSFFIFGFELIKPTITIGIILTIFTFLSFKYQYLSEFNLLLRRYFFPPFLPFFALGLLNFAETSVLNRFEAIIIFVLFGFFLISPEITKALIHRQENTFFKKIILGSVVLLIIFSGMIYCDYFISWFALPVIYGLLIPIIMKVPKTVILVQLVLTVLVLLPPLIAT